MTGLSRAPARKRLRLALVALAALPLLAFGTPSADASSHREAPGITQHPKMDATDFYMFRSYESGRDGFVTLVACYYPLQDPQAGPNYFQMDEDGLYEIHIDNDGDAIEDLTFQFRFTRTQKNIQIPVGDPGSEVMVDIPLANSGAFGLSDGTAAQNVEESYTVTLVTGDRRTGTSAACTQTDGSTTFTKPFDYIGEKSNPDYMAYANSLIVPITIPGAGMQGRVFVGQRKDPFVVNLGEAFDLVNTNPVGPENGEQDTLANRNCTAICLEVPISFLTDGDDVIGAWTSSSLRQARVQNPTPDGTTPEAVHGGAWTQVSRLGMPLVNELVIGLSAKDRFNASEPTDDGQFATYVTNPTFPELLQLLFGVQAPNAFPRGDLVQVFLTGVPGLNQPAGVQASEMMRLNTATPVLMQGSQNRLGVIAGDGAGYPNGRRPGDDVVDITLRVAMGVLLSDAEAPDRSLPYTDGAFLDDSQTDATFPYLRTPLPGAVSGP